MKCSCPIQGSNCQQSDQRNFFEHQQQDIMKYEKVSQLLIVLFNINIFQFWLNQIQPAMYSKLMMIGGLSLLSVSYYYLRKQKYFIKLFDQIQKSNKFHLDYVDDLSKLPLNKDILLFGQPKSDNPQQVLLTTYLKKIKNINKQSQQRKSQIEVPKDDRFWSLQFSGQFYMKTLSNQKITIKKDQKQILYAFNLPKRNQNQNFEERVIIKNQPVCVYGKLQNIGNSVLLKTKMILGTKNQSFLAFLDGQIMKLNRKSKVFAITGISLFFAHALRSRLEKDPILSEVIHNKNIKSNQTQEILKQIQQSKLPKENKSKSL